MPHHSLTQHYRPQTFAALIGQPELIQVLCGALQTGRIAPAYLFTGVRGTGKTSSARIFAKSLNCQRHDQPTPTPCGVCDACQTIARGDALDVIEIDAASSTGVDNIRQLIERAQFVPLQCRYKVFIIDEAHMLSTAAFNALLKTLEEPPAHVVFILATTEPQRLLPTIISRCQRFDFRSIAATLIESALATIAAQEGIAATPAALKFMAQRAKGGLRDALNLLEQARLLSPITLETLYQLVGALPEDRLLALVTLFIQPQADAMATALDICEALLLQGHKPLTVLEGLVQVVTDLQVALQAPTRPDRVTDSALWEPLSALAADCSVLQLQVLGNQMRAAADCIRYSEQGGLWLKRLVLDLLVSHESVTAPVPGGLSLPQQWLMVVAQLPAGIRPLIDPGVLKRIESGVATITYEREMMASIARSQVSAIERAFQAAGLGVMKVVIETA